MLASLLLWIFCFPSILYYCILSLTLILLFICYKMNQATCIMSQEIQQLKLHDTSRTPREVILAMLKRRKLVVTRSATTTLTTNPSYQLLALVAILILSLSCTSILCREQDAQILMPLATLSKNIIATITLGVPIQFDLSAKDIVKNFAYLTWRTGFPVTMPKGFLTNAQDYFEKIRLRVEETSVEGLKRKTLADLKVDLDEIVDAIVKHVRESDDGLYTNYKETMVNGVSLEDACVAVGVQLKAYGVDIKNYRNIAGAILGLPVVPHVASGIVGAAKMVPTLKTVNNLTRVVLIPINQLPNVSQHVSHIAQGSANAVFRFNPSAYVSGAPPPPAA